MAHDDTTFSLANKALKLTTAADIEPHLGPLSASSAPTSLTSISLQGNTIGIDAAATLAPLLARLHALKDANLADIFTARLLSEIPPALSSLLTALAACPKLVTINLSDNAFGLNTVSPLVDYLTISKPLNHLLLNNNGLGPDAGAKVANALTSLAGKQGPGNGLVTIVCGRNRLETGSMAAWAKTYQAHAASIKEVRMVQNGIRQEGIQLLLREGLAHASVIEVLDLQDNTFTRSGALALTEVVTGWKQLRELGVGDCLLSARGMVLLSEALAKGENKNLEVLRLQYNEIDAKGVKSLVDAIEKDALPKLRRVELNGNKFAEEDSAIERLRELLDERKGDDADEENWGLDELSDLEDDSDDEDEDDDEDAEEDKKKGEKEMKDADDAENQNVAEEKDKAVDDLADQLGKTAI